VLKAPLAAAVNDYEASASDDGPVSCHTLEAWSSRASGGHLAVITGCMEEAGCWVNGVLSWLAGELGTRHPAAEGSC
jgi:hypothetical protein